MNVSRLNPALGAEVTDIDIEAGVSDETFESLHRAWPEARYCVVEDAGHSSREPGICRELVAAMDAMKQISA